jgi:NADH dehydrogenase
VGTISYDYLILAAGSTNHFFGVKSLEADTHGLKDIDEAMSLRNHILSRFEAAVWERDPSRRRSLLTFVIVGGGPTGVEFAGALSELVGVVLPRDFPGLDFHEVNVILMEASDRLLSMLGQRLQRYALKTLSSKGVEVRLNTAVERLAGGRLYVKDADQVESSIEAGTVMWAAGVRAAELAIRPATSRGRQGRLSVLPGLQLAEHPEVFAIGDIAAAEQDGAVLPMLAPVAQQEARWAAKNIGRLLRGEVALPFRYRDKGTMATIGRQAAVVQIGPFKFTGFFAWLLWLGLHIVQLIGFRNRLLVLINWAWDYFFYDRGVRLILGDTAVRRARVSSEQRIE